MAKFATLQVGEKLSENQYYSVEKVRGNEVDVKTSTGEIVTLPKDYVDTFLVSGSQFNKTEKVSRTEGIALLTANANIVMSVNFNKKIEDKDVNAGKKAIISLIEGKTTVPNPVKFVEATLSSITEGEERTIVGYHSGDYNEFGRLKFIDLQAGSGFNIRQVDPRTINWLIIKNIKYEVK